MTDWNVGQDLTENVTRAVGAENLFDVCPDRNGIIDASGSGAYGSLGLSRGVYYARVGLRF